MAAKAASQTWAGVSKSGSPISRWITSRPSRSSSFARARTLKALSVPSRSRLAASREATTSLTGESVARGASFAREVGAEVVDHVSRVVLDAVDEGRFPPAQHRQAQGVEAGAVDDDAAAVAKMAFLVHDR